MTYKEAADDGADGGTEEGGHGEDACRQTALCKRSSVSIQVEIPRESTATYR